MEQNQLKTSPVQVENVSELIDLLAEKLTENYVFPEIAARLVDVLRDHQLQGHYDCELSAVELCGLLTQHLQEISHDKHLRVRFSESEPSDDDLERSKRIVQRVQAQNFGFNKVERLSGNIGYIELRSFAPTELAGETLVHAMGFLANTDAMIIDLRENGGGVPSMVCLLCSYLLPEESVHLNSFYWRR